MKGFLSQKEVDCWKNLSSYAKMMNDGVSKLSNEAKVNIEYCYGLGYYNENLCESDFKESDKIILINFYGQFRGLLEYLTVCPFLVNLLPFSSSWEYCSIKEFSQLPRKNKVINWKKIPRLYSEFNSIKDDLFNSKNKVNTIFNCLSKNAFSPDCLLQRIYPAEFIKFIHSEIGKYYTIFWLHEFIDVLWFEKFIGNLKLIINPETLRKAWEEIDKEIIQFNVSKFKRYSVIGGPNIAILNLNGFKFEISKYLLGLIAIFQNYGELDDDSKKKLVRYKEVLFTWLNSPKTKNGRLDFDDVGVKSQVSIRTVRSYFKKS